LTFGALANLIVRVLSVGNLQNVQIRQQGMKTYSTEPRIHIRKSRIG